MQENETSGKKSGVKFDETRNVIKKFAKNERIEPLIKKNNKKVKSLEDCFEEEESKPTKLRKTSDSPTIEI